jgi:hypothetical protein
MVDVVSTKKLRWFDAGALALRAFVEQYGRGEFPDGEWYLCPACCKWIFGREAKRSRSGS